MILLINIILFLFIPLLFALLFLVCNKEFYLYLSYTLFILCTLISIQTLFQNQIKISISGTAFNIIEASLVIGEFLMIFYFYYLSIKHKKPFIFALNVLQTIFSIFILFFLPKARETYFTIDKLSLIMLLIINIIGTLIIIFSNGYITKYEKHRQLKCRQKVFYPIICVFLASMNGLVISDSLSFVYFFWEITTLTSFILISYNLDTEALKSGFNALFLNMIGGVSFSLGIILFKTLMNIENFTQITESRKGRLNLYITSDFFMHSWFCKVCTASFSILATRSNGCPYSSVCTITFKHYGKGRCISNY